MQIKSPSAKMFQHVASNSGNRQAKSGRWTSPREKTMRSILVAAAMFLATLAMTVALAATGFM
jgi:hypothetical protein